MNTLWLGMAGTPLHNGHSKRPSQLLKADARHFLAFTSRIRGDSESLLCIADRCVVIFG
jgi:hypothetical protein